MPMPDTVVDRLLAKVRAARHDALGGWPSELVRMFHDIDEPVLLAEFAARLSAEPVSVRIAAASILGDCGNPETLEALEPLLRDPDGKVRLAAVLAVEEYGAVDDLVAALVALIDTDSDPQTRTAAVRSLGNVSSPDADAALSRALSDQNSAVVAAAETTLAHSRRRPTC